MRLTSLKPLISGLVLVTANAVVACGLAPMIPLVDPVSLALLLGAGVRGAAAPSARFERGIGFAEHHLLALAIILMGFQFRLGEVVRLLPLMGIVVPTVIVTFLAALGFGKWLGYSARFSLLLGAGNAICGASAIAGVASGLKVDEREIGISVGVVNLLGTIGIVTVPLVALYSNLGATDSAYLIGGSLQAIGQVVAAGYSLGGSVGELSTVVKMFRVMMLIPVVLVLPLVVRFIAQAKTDKADDTTGATTKFRLIPGYLLGFLACSLAGSLMGDGFVFAGQFSMAAKFALVLAMAAIGLRIDPRHLAANAPKAILCGALVCCVQIAFLMAMLHVVPHGL